MTQHTPTHNISHRCCPLYSFLHQLLVVLPLFDARTIMAAPTQCQNPPRHSSRPSTSTSRPRGRRPRPSDSSSLNNPKSAQAREASATVRICTSSPVNLTYQSPRLRTAIPNLHSHQRQVSFLPLHVLSLTVPLPSRYTPRTS